MAILRQNSLWTAPNNKFYHREARIWNGKHFQVLMVFQKLHNLTSFCLTNAIFFACCHNVGQLHPKNYINLSTLHQKPNKVLCFLKFYMVLLVK